MEKIQKFFQSLAEWIHSPKGRKTIRTASKVADTTAYGIGAVLRLIVRIFVSAVLILFVTGLLFMCIFAVYVKTCMTQDMDISLEEAQLSLSSTMWYKDSDGNWQEMTKLYSNQNRTWVDFENLPIDLQHAAVAIEDKRFYEHKGVDWYRTVAAFANMFIAMDNNFGGSTITQQLIKNLTEYDDVTVQRKLLEIFRALEFEKNYTKNEIMTWYLNEIYLGEGAYGVGAAARTYFGKDVWDLSLAECATIIGITNNPSLYDPYIYPENTLIRRDTILKEMYEQDYITYDEYIEAVNTPIELDYSEEDDSSTRLYTWYEEVVIQDAVLDLAEAKGISTTLAENLVYSGGYNIYTCIDMRIQNILDDYYQDVDNLPQPYYYSSQQLRSAIVIIEPTTGDIVGLEGDVGEKTINMGLNLATDAKRPPGSSFKPLSVYSPALDTGLVNQQTLVNDSAGIVLSGTSWFPQNSDGYSGVITVHDALVNSKNTIAAQLLDALGLGTSWDYLTNHYGITSLIPNDGTYDYTDYAYAPLALGQLSEGITVREMAQAYTAFVNEGKMSYGRTYSCITDQDGNLVLDNPTKNINSISANTAANMCHMMQDAVYSGTGTEAYIGNTAVGGKTGTTEEDKDRYFCGITRYYVAAIWTGYEMPEKMYFSGNPACQIFSDLMSEILDGYEYWDFPSYTLGSSSLKSAVATVSPSPSPSESPSPSPSETPAEETPTEENPTPSPVPTVEPTLEPVCEHDWIADYTQIPAVTHEEEYVVEEAYDQETTDENGNPITIHHDAVYGTKTVVDVEAYSVVSGYHCSKCGATKAAE